MSTYDSAMMNRPASAELAGLASAVLTGSLAGFLTVSYIPGAVGVDSRVATVPFRGFMLLLLIYAFFRLLGARHLRKGMSVTTLLAVFFWTAYCTRFIADTTLLQVPLVGNPTDMALFLFAMCIPTFVVFYQIRDINLYRKSLVWSMLALGVCCVISLIRTQTARDITTQGGYQANEVLNHITYGHMGVTAVILGLFVFLRIDRVSRPWHLRLLAAAAAILGAFSILASASRGAMVAGVLLIPVVAYLGLRRGSKFLTIAICVALAFALSVSVAYLTQNGADLARQVGTAAAYSSANVSVQNRENMYRDAWAQYLDHPWFGSSIQERNSLSYPHNAVIEAFMATGTFGGTAFALLVLIAVVRAIRLMGRNPAMAWIPLCFFQQLIGAMFSGGLYNNVPLWGMMAIMLGADIPRRARKAIPTAIDPRGMYAANRATAITSSLS